MTVWSGRIRQPVGTFTRAWLESPPPIDEPSVVGVECDERGCHSIIVGTTREEAARRLAEHRRRCHEA